MPPRKIQAYCDRGGEVFFFFFSPPCHASHFGWNRQIKNGMILTWPISGKEMKRSFRAPPPVGRFGMFYFENARAGAISCQQTLGRWIVGREQGLCVSVRVSVCVGGTNVLLPLPPPPPPPPPPPSSPPSSTFTPSLTRPRRAGLVHLSALSWEGEVPSHLTLRKWFQCVLV